MYHQVPEYYRNISGRVSNILNVIGYSREDRDRKVMVAVASDAFNDIITMHFDPAGMTANYLVGSRGEGSTGPGLQSDRDVLYMHKRIKLVTDLSECQTDKANLLMVHDDFTHPGYVKLQLVKILVDNTPYPIFHYQIMVCRVDSYGRSVISNHLTRCIFPAGVFSGPAMRIENGDVALPLDSVFAVRCTQWPNQAHEWLQRRRLHGWPNSRQLQNSRKDGCFAAAVGHPLSHEKDREWRLSFSFTERELIRSFEDTEMKVYVMLKMIRKTYIEPVLGDAFSSYHCKVCILWVREKTPTELWRTENILCCLNMCMKQLYEWVTMGYCPDYFIVTNNIYDRKIFGEVQFMLTRILAILVSEDYRMLLGLECCNFGQLLLHDCNSLEIIRNSTIIKKYLHVDACVDYGSYFSAACSCRYFMFMNIPQEYNILASYIRRILQSLQYAPQTLRIYLHHVLMILFSRMGFHVVSVCKENAYSLSQEEVDYLMAFASRCLSLGINSDATSVRLKLCGLGIMLGDYDLTEICLQHISDHSMRTMFSDKIGDIYSLSNVDFALDMCATERCSPEELLQKQISFSVIYLPSETSITPTPLKMEMFRSVGATPALRNTIFHFWYDWIVVDPRMCLYFFQYLNFFSLRKERHKQAAFDNMIHVMRRERLIPHRETELNLLGYCFMRQSQLRYAFICFNKSLKTYPYHNAAKFYLGIMFRKVHTARLRRSRN